MKSTHTVLCLTPHRRALITAAVGLMCASGYVRAQNMLAVPVDTAPSANAARDAGTIDEVLSTSDGGYLMRGYITTWHGGHVFVSMPANLALHAGDTAMPVVTRNENVLRFNERAPERYTDPADTEEAEARASSTLGTSKVDQVLKAEDAGSRYVAYVVSWHDAKVVVVDPTARSNFQIGDAINFRVVRTGSSDDKRLSFALSPARSAPATASSP